MKKFFLFATLLLALQTAQAQVFVTNTGFVSFISDAPFEKFTGTSKSLTGRIDAQTDTVDFYLDLNTLRTGIKLRDEHMRENYLETSKYPFAEFYGVLVKKPDYTRRTRQPVQVKGQFKIHGVAREMVIDGFLTPTANGIDIEAAWQVKLSDHNIPIPSIIIRKLSEIQDVSIKASLTPATKK